MIFNPLRPILAILLLFIPLYPKFPLTFAPGSQVAFRLDDIVVAISIFIYLLYQLKNGFPVLKFRLTWLIIGYWLVIAASLINALLIYQSSSVTQLFLHTLRRIEYMFLFFIAFSSLKAKNYKFALPFSLLAFLGIFVYGLGQKYWHFPIISTMNYEFAKGQLLQMDVWTRISATFAGHYDLAAYLSVFSALVLGLSFLVKPFWLNILLKINWLLSFYLLTQTASRVSTFSYWGGALLLVVLLKKFIWVVPVSALMITSLLTSADLNQRLLATIPTFKHLWGPSTLSPAPIPTPEPALPTTQPLPTPIVTTPVLPTPTVFRHKPEEFPPIDVDAGVARSGEIRFKVEWPRAITAWQKNHLLGTGLGSLGLATDNDYLRLLGESGALGFASFILIFLHLIILSLKRWSQPLVRVFLVSILIFFANAIFIDVFEASKTAYLFWILMGIFYYFLTAKKDDRLPP